MGSDGSRPALADDGGDQPLADYRAAAGLWHLSAHAVEAGLPGQMPLAVEFPDDQMAAW